MTKRLPQNMLKKTFLMTLLKLKKDIVKTLLNE